MRLHIRKTNTTTPSIFLRALNVLISALMCLGVSATVLASKSINVDQIVVFGDSYSDNGNTYASSHTTYPGQAYYLGHFLNGQNWSEYFSEKLGIDPMDQNRFRNFAYGQAQIADPITLTTHGTSIHKASWQFTIPDLRGEIDQYIQEGNICPVQTIYFIFIGTNDFLNYIPQSESQNEKFVVNKVKALVNQIKRLNKLGATRIVLFNMRDLKTSPLAKQLEKQYQNHYLGTLNTMINQYNFLISKQYKNSKTVIVYDIHKFDEHIFRDQISYKWHRQNFNLKEKIDPCYINQGNYIDKVSEICADPWHYLYYDRIHFTTFIDKLMSNDLFSFVAKKIEG